MSLLDSAMRALNTAGMTELETTCFKATYPDETRSKEKHVESSSVCSLSNLQYSHLNCIVLCVQV